MALISFWNVRYSVKTQVRLTENTPNKPTASKPDYFDLDAVSGSEEKECVVEGSSIHVEKFYDADLNGIQNIDEELEPNIEGWLVEVTPFFNGEVVGTSSTTGLTTAWIDVSSGTYVAAEAQVENWAPTNHIPTVIEHFTSDNAIVVSSSTILTVSEGESKTTAICVGFSEFSKSTKVLVKPRIAAVFNPLEFIGLKCWLLLSAKYDL